MIPAKLTFLISNIVICLLLTVISTVGITRQLQMLQLNSYFASRYFGWLKQNKKYIAANIFFILLSALAAAFLRLRDRSLDLLFKFIEPKLGYALIFLVAGGGLLVVLAVAAYIFAANPICLILPRQDEVLAEALAADNAGKSIAASMAMIAITTRSSIRVKHALPCPWTGYLPSSPQNFSAGRQNNRKLFWFIKTSRFNFELCCYNIISTLLTVIIHQK